MPYKLRKAPKKALYWVVTTETGKKHSKLPIPMDKAKAQMRILESALKGGGTFKDELIARLAPFDRDVQEAVYAHYEPILDNIKSGVNILKGRFSRDEAKRQQKRNIIEAAVADATEIQERMNREELERQQTSYRALPYKKVPKGTEDPITLKPIGQQGTLVSTITETPQGQRPKEFFFDSATLQSWEQQQLRQGRNPSNPLTNLPYAPRQRQKYKAQDPDREPVQQWREMDGWNFPLLSRPGREKFESAPPPSPTSELDGEGRRRGKGKCKPPYHDYSKGKASVFALTCIDPRYTYDAAYFLHNKKELHQDYDLFTLAGASVGATKKEWTKAFFDNLELGIKLHGIKEVWCFDHLDCGMYKATFNLKEDLNPKIHIDCMDKLKKLIKKKHPELKFRSFLIDAKGHVSSV